MALRPPQYAGRLSHELSGPVSWKVIGWAPVVRTRNLFPIIQSCDVREEYHPVVSGIFCLRFFSGYRYYLNKRRCETGGMRAIASWLDPAPTYPHVNVLAVDSSCETVFYHSKVVGKWSSYEKGRAKDIDCSQS